MPIPILKMATVGILPSRLKVLYYKSRGAKIGRNVSIGLFSILHSKEIHIGEYSKIGPLSFLTAKKINIGKRVKINSMVAIETGVVDIGNDTTIMEQVVVGGMLTPRSRIKIGRRVKIFPYSFINPTEPIIIEDDVGIGGANYIFTHGSWQSKLDGFPISFGPVTIKKGVWFPWRVFVMPNVTVGEYATIGAGSIITKDIPNSCLAAGSPAKVLREKEEYIKTFSDDEKVQIIIDIIKEFNEYLTFLDKESKIQNTDKNSIQILCSEFSLLFSTSIDKYIDFNIIISYSKIPNGLREILNSKKIIWFDIECRETVFYNNFSWRLTSDFFSRYGIRFEIYPE